VNGVNVHDNAASGIWLQTGSSGVLTDVVTAHNGLDGLDVQSGSAATVTGALTSTGNRVFGVNVNGSSITFADAIVTAVQNALGIQIATNANAFLNDPDTVINAINNLATGLTAFATRADLRTLTFGTETCDATVLIRGPSGIVCP
jgi:hypothetical protein